MAAGEEVRITSRGRVIARLTAEADARESAMERLEALRGTPRADKLYISTVQEQPPWQPSA